VTSHRIDEQGSDQSHGVSRRVALVALSGAGIASAGLLMGTRRTLAAAQDASPPAETGPTAGQHVDEFIGVVRPGEGHHADEIFVAVLIDSPIAPSTARRVRAYLCDGRQITEWYVGETVTDDVTLDSDDGDARIELALSSERVSGSFQLSDGNGYEFSATRPTGRGGLFRIFLTEDLVGFGASERGTLLNYRIEDGVATGMFVFADGRTDEFSVPTTDLETGHFRLLVLDSDDSNHLRGSSFKPSVPRGVTTQEDVPRYVWMCLDVVEQA
jgi:hypothetical protein